MAPSAAAPPSDDPDDPGPSGSDSGTDAGGRFDAKSCGAVVFRVEDGAPVYLLLHYPGGHWDFIKGHTEPGETEEGTTRREAEEETGIADLAFHPDFRATIDYWYHHGGERVHKLVVFRLARTEADRDSVRLSHEHQGYDWLPYEKALDRLTYDNAKRVLKEAHAAAPGML